MHEADPRAWPDRRRTAGRELLTLLHRLLLTAAALGAVGLAWYGRGRRVPWAAQTSVFVVVCALTIRGFADDSHPFFWLAVLPPLVALLHLPGRPWQGPAGRALLGLLAITSATHALFFGDDRYHLVVVPALCILAAAALRKPLQRHRERSATPVS